MPESLVSVVIPCFNAEAYVADAIESALDQTAEVEVIVIDDGSTDSSLEVIRRYQSRIRWETGPNRGGNAARNRGLELAEGDFVQFLDADDVLMPGKVAAQLSATPDDERTVAFCNWHVETLDGAILERASPAYSGPDPVQILMSFYMQTASPLHRTSWLRKVGGFRQELPAAQEYDLHLRLVAAGLRLVHVPAVLYTVRRVPASVSSDTAKTLRLTLDMLLAFVEELRAGGAFDEARARAVANRMARNGRTCMQRGDAEAASDFFDAAKRIHPGGGLDEVYGLVPRLLHRGFGPAVTERLVAAKRTIASRFRRQPAAHGS